jgi:predicted nucleic acid-binding protein
VEPAILGLILDSSVLIAAERSKLTPADAIESVQQAVGPVPIAMSVMTIAEIGHGIYRATESQVRARRRAFLDELKSTIPTYGITETIAEVVASIGGEQAAKGLNIPLGDLLIGATALDLGYAVGTSNARDFDRIPGLRVVRL